MYLLKNIVGELYRWKRIGRYVDVRDGVRNGKGTGATRRSMIGKLKLKNKKSWAGAQH